MPPKKGKKGKGKKGKKGKKESAKSETAENEDDIFVDKEELLQKELDQLTEQLQTQKDKVDELRKETDWLQQEAAKVRVESHEYMSYMEKKTTKRQTTIITLNDANQDEIRTIQQEKEKLLSEFETQKEALRNEMLMKEVTLSRIKQKLEDLSYYKELQKEQLDRIKELERKVMQKRAQHSEAMTELKTKFLNEKRSFQTDAETKISAMAKEANKEAFFCLNEHTLGIKQENRELRHRLLTLIRQTKSLHSHRRHLVEQQRQLTREKQYADDLKKLHSARQHKVLNAFGMVEKTEDINYKDYYDRLKHQMDDQQPDQEEKQLTLF